MQELAPAYLSAIAARIGGLSAFLGGFSATFLGALLALGGWARSKATGRTTTIAAAIGMMLTTWLIVSVG